MPFFQQENGQVVVVGGTGDIVATGEIRQTPNGTTVGVIELIAVESGDIGRLDEPPPREERFSPVLLAFTTVESFDVLAQHIERLRSKFAEIVGTTPAPQEEWDS